MKKISFLIPLLLFCSCSNDEKDKPKKEYVENFYKDHFVKKDPDLDKPLGIKVDDLRCTNTGNEVYFCFLSWHEVYFDNRKTEEQYTPHATIFKLNEKWIIKDVIF